MRQALDIFRALADPTRLRIFSLLRAMELSVGELAQVLGQSQPRVSRHVKILCDAGIADRRKEGSWVFLGLGEEARIAPLLATVDALVGTEPGDPWTVADIARLAAVRADRAAAAERYFAAHADEWDAIRSLHVAESEVEAAILRALGDEPVGRLVDVGTGTGRMIELLGPGAASVLGIDRSPEMLRLARSKLAASGQDRAELRQGDMYALPLPNECADTVLIHQVLHYAQQPAAAVADAGRLLATVGGCDLIVTSPATIARNCAPATRMPGWASADEQIAGWFGAAGLALDSVAQLEGGELTVKLWLGRRTAAKMVSKAA